MVVQFLFKTIYLFYFKVIIIFFITICHFSFGQGLLVDVLRDNDSLISEMKYYIAKSNRPQLVKLESYFRNGQMATQENFLNGLRNGLYKEYYDNGKIKVNGQYNQDNRFGLWTEYFKEGGYRKVFLANANVKDVNITEYYENGKIKLRGTYSLGEKDGFWTSWYPNGLIKSFTNYKDGKRMGIFTYFHENGNKKCEGVISYEGGKEERCWDEIEDLNNSNGID